MVWIRSISSSSCVIVCVRVVLERTVVGRLMFWQPVRKSCHLKEYLIVFDCQCCHTSGRWRWLVSLALVILAESLCRVCWQALVSCKRFQVQVVETSLTNSCSFRILASPMWSQKMNYWTLCKAETFAPVASITEKLIYVHTWALQENNA